MSDRTDTVSPHAMSTKTCPTCNGAERIVCPGPNHYKTKAERPPDAREFIDYCYGMHMGHCCPDCTPEDGEQP